MRGRLAVANDDDRRPAWKDGDVFGERFGRTGKAPAC
jgi:hypothetical protein